jgi:hypothetical protein
MYSKIFPDFTVYNMSCKFQLLSVSYKLYNYSAINSPQWLCTDDINWKSKVFQNVTIIFQQQSTVQNNIYLQLKGG